MPVTVNNLYPQIYDYGNLWESYKAAIKNKTQRPDVLRFEWQLEENLINIQNHLIYKTWTPHPFREFTVYEPKRRDISAPVFRDRIVHHALCRVIEPYFERRFVGCSYACRVGLGTHAAVHAAQKYIKRAASGAYIFKGDISRYFYSISHDLLRSQYRRVIQCKDTLWLMDTIVNQGGSNGVGIPIGALTSQLLANIALDPLDHYVKDVLGAQRYARYMDDFIVVADTKAEARDYWWQIQNYVEFKLGLTLNPKSCIQPLNKGLNFCGYRIWPTHTLPRKRNIRRVKKRLRKMINLYHTGKCTEHAINQVWASYLGYMKHCNGHDTVVSTQSELNQKIQSHKEVR